MTRLSKNPFTPTFGKVPPVLAGREDILEDIAEALDSGPGDPNLSTILVGARGTGKTTLLACIREEALAHGWISVGVTAGAGMLDDILQQVTQKASDQLAQDSERHVTGVTVGPVGLTWETSASQHGNWRTRMGLLLDQLEETNTGMLITVDEVSLQSEEMVQLATVYQHFVTENREVALIMAGLPYDVLNVLNDSSVSFLRRSRQRHLGRIADYDIADALRSTVSEASKAIDSDALDYCVAAVDGFPYMMQLVGYHTWRAARDSGVISLEHAVTGVERARSDMRDNVFAATYRELSTRDVQFLEAMLPDHDGSALKDVSKRMGFPSNYTSKYKSRLLNAGVIDETPRGLLAFALPGFAEYVREMAEPGE